jgi:hypothetical protein
MAFLPERLYLSELLELLRYFGGRNGSPYVNESLESHDFHYTS